jgi:hypothetical protein
MEELLAGDVGARPVRHYDGKVSGKLEMQAAAAMWMQKNSELKGQARERKEAEEKRSTRGFKGDRPDSPSSVSGPP